MKQLVAMLRFVRIPLVWTALADSLAGAAIAARCSSDFDLASLWPLALISPGLYLFGMGINDLLDIESDRRSGNDRPLARGELSPGAAVLALVFLLGAVLIGAACVSEAALRMTALTLGAIAIYNALAKRWTPTSMVFMAACRVGNILIGWSLVTHNWRFDLDPHGRAPHAWALLASVAALTAMASLVSGLEKRRSAGRVLGLAPSRVILALLLLLPVADSVNVMIAWGGSLRALTWLAAIPLVLVTASIVRKLRGPSGDIPQI
jgi:4-hydroxybenzoate polyprenyltransferase